MSKAAIIGVVMVVGIGVVGGGGYYYLTQQVEQQFQDKVKEIRATFPGDDFSFKDHHIHIFSRNVTMDDVVFKQKSDTIYTIKKVDMTLSSGNSISKFVADNIVVKQGEDDTAPLKVELLQLDDVKTSPGWIVVNNGVITELYSSKVSFGLLDIHNIQFNDNKSTAFKIAQYQVKNYGMGQKTDSLLKDLSITYGDNEYFKLGSVKYTQVNQAEFMQDQEKIFKENNWLSLSDTVINQYLQALSKLKFDLFSIDDLQFAIEDVVTFKLDHYDFKNYGIGRYSDQSFKNLSMTNIEGGKGYLKVASFDLNGIDWALFAQLSQKFDFSDYDTIMLSATPIIKKYEDQLCSNTNNMSVTGVEGFNSDLMVSLNSINSNSQLDQHGAREAKYSLDKLSFAFPERNADSQILRDMGYDKITVSGELNAKYQKDMEALSVSLNNLSFQDMGVINATLKMNIPFDLHVDYQNPESSLTNSNIKFREFTFTLQDKGFIENLVKYAMHKQDISEEDAKTKIVHSVNESIEGLESLSPSFVNEAKNAIESFIKNPKGVELSLSSKPETPISYPLLSGKDEQEIFNLFNLHVQTVPVK